MQEPRHVDDRTDAEVWRDIGLRGGALYWLALGVRRELRERDERPAWTQPALIILEGIEDEQERQN